MNAIGIDFGGTWIRAAIVGKDGLVSRIVREETGAERRPKHILNTIVDVITILEKEEDESVCSIGVGIPTTLDEKDRLVECPNLPTMTGFSLRGALQKSLRKHVVLANDADCFALGEWLWGAGKGTRNMIGMTLGTSVGLGIILNGCIFSGEHGEAGEIWRSPIRLLLESEGNIHAALRADAIHDAYHHKTGCSIGSDQISIAALNGDPIANEIISDYASVLGKVLLWLANIVDPGVIVLGGSAASNFKLMRERLKAELSRTKVLIRESELGEAAAVLGAASITLNEKENRKDE